jgi:hypothetical protein
VSSARFFLVDPAWLPVLAGVVLALLMLVVVVWVRRPR